MSDDAIRTVVEGATAEFTVSGSRFIGHVAPANDEAAVEEVISAVADDHPDATHVVWAYRLSGQPIVERATDDGEPGGSAGEPALGVLRGEDLKDTVAVVVRYYGGTNLGYGGLVRAYSRAVGDAIEAASTERRQPTTSVQVQFGYDDSGSVHSILDSEGVEYEAAYEECVTVEVTLPTNRAEAVIDRIQSATGGRAAIEW